MADLEPIQLPESIKKDTDTYSDTYGKFEIGPLESGFGTTVGNSLRRVLLSTIQGAAVNYVQVEGLEHQYTPIPHAREDYVEFILNLKKLAFQIDVNGEVELEINVTGPKVVTAGDITCSPSISMVDKDQYLLELVEEGEFHAKLWAKNGIGYIREDEHPVGDKPIGVIPMDSIYSPVRKVNYSVGKQRVDQKINYDKLTIEVWTDGSIAPQDALSLSAKLLKDCYLRIMVFEEEPKFIKREKVDPELLNLQKLMDMRISELELSVRCSNCLSAAKIEYVKELVCRTESQMLRLRNFGKKSLDEVKAVLDRYGLKLGMDVESIDKRLEGLKDIEEEQ